MFDVHTTALEIRELLDDLEPITRIGPVHGQPLAWVFCTAGDLCVGVQIETTALRVVTTLDHGPGADASLLGNWPYRTSRDAADSARQQIEAERARLTAPEADAPEISPPASG